MRGLSLRTFAEEGGGSHQQRSGLSYASATHTSLVCVGSFVDLAFFYITQVDAIGRFSEERLLTPRVFPVTASD